jgi:[citrate (pro-3S)-lyase] ligase
VRPEINLYYKDMGIKYQAIKDVTDESIVKGSIVMNCNPFTYGHRYLIEKALEQVDILYIFVVEEDKSQYSFDDRFEMVKEGTTDLKNIYIMPSGRYIISNDTFSQYFDKEKDIREIKDMAYDVRIFCEAVCKVFGITKRFVGTEPFDKVTKKYNETMARILPEYGIEFVEIPRQEIDGMIISASNVRRLISEGKIDDICSLVPESTMKFFYRGL